MMHVMTDNFAIFQDLMKATDIKIHRITCSAYINRDPTATTVKWHTTPMLQDAMRIAKRLAKEEGVKYRDCELCKVDRFAIMHDFWKVSDVKIHTIDCEKYMNRKLNATTVEWYAVPNFQDAENIAQRLAKEDNIKYGCCSFCNPTGPYVPSDTKQLHMDTKQQCMFCGDYIRGVMKIEGGKYEMFNLDDNSPHMHNRIATTQILSAKHYSSNEDKSKKIGDMTLDELEKRIGNIASKNAAMKLGTYLHAQYGYPDLGFGRNFFKKKIQVGEKEYYITAKPDDIKNDIIYEAKFPGDRRTFKKNQDYAQDQCDIYGWITGLVRCKIVIHVINNNTTNEIDYTSDHENGKRLVKEYIENVIQG